MKNIIPIITSLLFLVSCNNSKKEVSQEQPSDNSTSIENTPEVAVNKFEDPAFVNKYNAYIGFGNSFHSRAVESYQRYFSWADRDKGPKGNMKKANHSLYGLNESQLDRLKEVIDKNPKMEKLDPLMKTVYEKSKNLYEVVNDTKRYYDLEDYKDDDFKKGEELHSQLITAFDSYFDAYDSMSSEFRGLQDEFFAYDAEKYKKDGMDLRYNLMMNLNYAKNILDIIGPRDGQELSTIDMNTFENKIGKFRETFDEIEVLSKDEERVKRELNDVTGKLDLRDYIRDASEMIKELRNLTERIEKNDFKYSSHHQSNPDRGTPLKLEKIYSKLISKYNMMN